MGGEEARREEKGGHERAQGWECGRGTRTRDTITGKAQASRPVPSPPTHLAALCPFGPSPLTHLAALCPFGPSPLTHLAALCRDIDAGRSDDGRQVACSLRRRPVDGRLRFP